MIPERAFANLPRGRAAGQRKPAGQSARGGTSTGHVRHANTPQCRQVADERRPRLPIRGHNVPGVYSSRAQSGASGLDVTTLRPVRDQTVTDESVAYIRLKPGSGPLDQAGEPAAREPDSGQLIFTLVPASVSQI